MTQTPVTADKQQSILLPSVFIQLASFTRVTPHWTGSLRKEPLGQLDKVFTGQMLFLSSKQQSQSTKKNSKHWRQPATVLILPWSHDWLTEETYLLTYITTSSLALWCLHPRSSNWVQQNERALSNATIRQDVTCFNGLSGRWIGLNSHFLKGTKGGWWHNVLSTAMDLQ